MSDVSQEPTFAGIVKSFNLDRGWGHIDCPETRAIYGKDIFFMRSQLNGSMVNRGDSVLFRLRQGDKGIEAAEVFVSAKADLCSTAAAAGGVEVTERFIGIIKSCDALGKWGHIKCDRTQAIFGKDMFLMRSEIDSGFLRQGATVEFSVRQGLKGPEAVDVKELHGDHNPQNLEAQLQLSPEVQQLSPEVEQAAAQQLAAGIAGVVESQASLEFLQAQVSAATQATEAQASLAQSMHIMQAQTAQAWASMVQPQMIQPQPPQCEAAWPMNASEAAWPPESEAAWPGVTMPAFSEVAMSAVPLQGYDMWPDTNIDAATLAANTVGATVPAPDVTDLAGVEAVTGSDAIGQTFIGTVKSYNQGKGWGHVNCPETHSIYGKDMFMLRRSITSGSNNPKVGDRVEFTVQQGLKGPEARDISVITPWVRVTPY